MINQRYSHHLSPSSLPAEELLEDGEIILLVDDYPDIISLLQEFLQEHNFQSQTAGSAGEMFQILNEKKVALVLLDIGLPDGDGLELLPEIIHKYKNTAVIMLTAVADLQTALACLRQGADDYLTKPVQFTDLFETARKVLEKRRLFINNIRYQKQIEQARFRIQLLHELALKMNTAYLSMVELDEILQAILVGITAEEGLQFNRAVLALFDDSGEVLQGRLAIGPGCREEAGRIWHEMKEMELRFQEILSNIKAHCFTTDSEVNQIALNLTVRADDHQNILVRAAENRQSIHVVDGKCEYPVSDDLLDLLQEDSFVIVPLYSPSRSLGVIIADHFVTRKPITDHNLEALESFAGQASLAIEHCHLYTAMENKIKELEAVTYELDKNKDLLIEAERYSALGHMAAQLAHSIRNPVTTIGGTARMLDRKIDDPDLRKFFNVMTNEATKVEAILEDLFSFVEQTSTVKTQVPLYSLIHKSLMLYYAIMQKQNVECKLQLPEPEPMVEVDAKQIQQMFVHLIRNAVEAMIQGGTLSIDVMTKGRDIIVSIRDTGVGIETLNLSRATDPFFTTKTYGTGMGLTLVERICEEHNGVLEINNIEQGGTEAVIQLFSCVVSEE